MVHHAKSLARTYRRYIQHEKKIKGEELMNVADVNTIEFPISLQVIIKIPYYFCYYLPLLLII